MGKTRCFFRLMLLGLLLLRFGDLRAQFLQLPLENTGKPAKKIQIGNKKSKVQALSLSIPFWEDFSSGVLDTLKWQNNGAKVSNTIGINPPSLGAAYLD